MALPVEPATAPRRHAVFHELVVSRVDRLTDDAVAITFAVPPELREDYRFTQGQHVSLRHTVAGDEARRNYSISSPAGSGRLQVAVKLLPGGVFSSFAHSRLRAGDRLEVMTPTGRFSTPLDASARRRYVAIAAGSGITPILSIMATTLEVEQRSEFTLVYGNRTTQTIMFLEELEDLKNRYPDRVCLYHVLSRERLDVDLFSGRIEAGRLEQFLDTLIPPAGVDAWFLCGPASMVTGGREVLKARGVDPARIHTELFHAEGREEAVRPRAPTDAGSATVTVVLDGRASTFSLAGDAEPILDATLRIRADAPYACKGGVCGTCRARLVEGTVEMEQNYALEEVEVEAGYVLACQSHPTSARVTLDYDQ
ncbi:MAG: 1,2-phenylacetyl-CoA epoxidase subunit PaaE [Candidatus Dormibacteria bacterium]